MKIGNVRRNREEGKEHIVLADLMNEDGSIRMSGTLADVIRACEERQYDVVNIANAKIALQKMS
jgi:hypothetical protein